MTSISGTLLHMVTLMPSHDCLYQIRDLKDGQRSNICQIQILPVSSQQISRATPIKVSGTFGGGRMFAVGKESNHTLCSVRVSLGWVSQRAHGDFKAENAGSQSPLVVWTKTWKLWVLHVLQWSKHHSKHLCILGSDQVVLGRLCSKEKTSDCDIELHNHYFCNSSLRSASSASVISSLRSAILVLHCRINTK